MADVTIWDLEWSPDGAQLMFGMEYLYEGYWHYGLFVTDGSGYGNRVEDDVYLAAWLPDGGYAFTMVDYYPDIQTTIFLEPATFAPTAITVDGVISEMDPYLRSGLGPRLLRTQRQASQRTVR